MRRYPEDAALSPRPQKPEPPGPNPRDEDALALVRADRRHRKGCQCEYCRALARVCRLAQEHVDHITATKRVAWERKHGKTN